MRKTWIGPLCMVAAALCCVLLGEWASHRILDEGSPVSFQTYQTQTQAEYRHLGEEPMDYWETYTGFFDDFPFYCTEEMLEEELQAIRQWSETKRQTTPLWRPLPSTVWKVDYTHRRKGRLFSAPR